MALVPQYLASKEKQIEEARAALASRDFGPIRRFGHNLKGTGRGYGFPSIEDMGTEIERAATQADASRIAINWMRCTGSSPNRQARLQNLRGWCLAEGRCLAKAGV